MRVPALTPEDAEDVVRAVLTTLREGVSKKDVLVTPVEDERVIEQLTAYAADPALGQGVGSLTREWDTDDLDAFAREDLVEGASDLGVAVAK